MYFQAIGSLRTGRSKLERTSLDYPTTHSVNCYIALTAMFYLLIIFIKQHWFTTHAFG